MWFTIRRKTSSEIIESWKAILFPPNCFPPCVLHLEARFECLHLVCAYFLSLVNIPSCRIRTVALLWSAKENILRCPVLDYAWSSINRKCFFLVLFFCFLLLLLFLGSKVTSWLLTRTFLVSELLKCGFFFNLGSWEWETWKHIADFRVGKIFNRNNHHHTSSNQYYC